MSATAATPRLLSDRGIASTLFLTSTIEKIRDDISCGAASRDGRIGLDAGNPVIRVSGLRCDRQSEIRNGSQNVGVIWMHYGA